jgi:hypothetical protein
MAIQIKQVTVIDDSRNFINLASIQAGAAGTNTWTSGLSKVNFGDGILYGPGSPNGTSPLPSAGDIKIDGILKLNSLPIIPLA